MKIPVLLMILLLAACSCKEKQASPATASGHSQDSATLLKRYFPVLSFIKGEILEVDSTPVGIKKYMGDNKKKFSYIQPEEFHRLAAEFTAKELADSFFLHHYQETSFLDQSNNSATFMYTTTDGSLPLQRVDVLTSRGDVYDQVKTIYLQKNYRSGDTLIAKKLSWRPKKSFQIVTEKTKDSTQIGSEVVNVVWDNSEEE